MRPTANIAHSSGIIPTQAPPANRFLSKCTKLIHDPYSQCEEVAFAVCRLRVCSRTTSSREGSPVLLSRFRFPELHPLLPEFLIESPRERAMRVLPIYWDGAFAFLEQALTTAEFEHALLVDARTLHFPLVTHPAPEVFRHPELVHKVLNPYKSAHYYISSASAMVRARGRGIRLSAAHDSTLLAVRRKASIASSISRRSSSRVSI